MALIALVLTGTSVSAHRRDEFLQAARIGIDEQRVHLELSLTPGIAVAEAIIGDIDRNHDGSLSADEQGAYLNDVLGATQLAIDGRQLNVAIVASTFPSLEALRSGDAAIELEAITALPSLPAGRHQILFNNAYRRDISVYLTNALAPEDDRISITAQRRDPEQRHTTIEYAIASRSSAILPLWLFMPGIAAWLLIRLKTSRQRRQIDKAFPRRVPPRVVV